MLNLKQTMYSLLETNKTCSVIREVNYDDLDDINLDTTFKSNLFGYPLWPINKSEQLDSLVNQNPNLLLIAQINLESVSIPGFYRDGILQFFSLTGSLNFTEDEPSYSEEINTHQPQSFIAYHSLKDLNNGVLHFESNSLSYSTLFNNFQENQKNWPTKDIFFTPHDDYPDVQNFLNGDVSTNIYNKIVNDEINLLEYYFSDKILDLAEHIDCVDDFMIFANSLDSRHSKIDGYPKFISYDPRSDETKYKQLLLQLNLENFFDVDSHTSIYFFINPHDIPLLKNNQQINIFAQTQQTSFQAESL